MYSEGGAGLKIFIEEVNEKIEFLEVDTDVIKQALLLKKQVSNLHQVLKVIKKVVYRLLSLLCYLHTKYLQSQEVAHCQKLRSPLQAPHCLHHLHVVNQVLYHVIQNLVGERQRQRKYGREMKDESVLGRDKVEVVESGDGYSKLFDPLTALKKGEDVDTLILNEIYYFKQDLFEHHIEPRLQPERVHSPELVGPQEDLVPEEQEQVLLELYAVALSVDHEEEVGDVVVVESGLEEEFNDLFDNVLFEGARRKGGWFIFEMIIQLPYAKLFQRFRTINFWTQAQG